MMKSLKEKRIHLHPPGRLSTTGVLDVGLKCTHSCRFCYYSYLDQSEHQFSGIRKASFRSLEECITILNLLKQNGMRGFDYTGGEPTLHPDIVEIARHAHRVLNLKGRIITLGQFLMKKMGNCRRNRLIEDLVEEGVTNFLFSIHAPDEKLFGEITGASFERLERALNFLDGIGFDYTVNTTVFEKNYTLLPAIAELSLRHRVYLHNFILMNAYYAWNINGRAFGVQASYSKIFPYLERAVDILDSNGVAVNIRYAPLCTVMGLEKHLVGLVGVRYDPYEWMNRGGHLGGTPAMSAEMVAIDEGYAEESIRLKRVSGVLDNRFDIVALRGEKKVFVSPCESCGSMECCDGIDPNYVMAHGIGEFHPYREDEKGPLLSYRRKYLAPFLMKDEPFSPMKEFVSSLVLKNETQVLWNGMKNEPLTSIIVVNLNGACCIENCIGSILTKTDVPFELIVIDNGSEDASLEYLKSIEGITLILNKENLGAPAARNQGLSIAKGSYIAFFDSDTIVTEGWISRFIDCARRHPRAGVFGPMSNCVSGPQCTMEIPYENDQGLQRFAAAWSACHSKGAVSVRRLVLFSMFVRREVIDRIGGIDPIFGKWGWEDDDFSVRAQLAGFELLIAKDIFIHHEGSRTLNACGLDCRKLHEENWNVFKKKWKIGWEPGRASQEELDRFFSRPFVKDEHYVPIPERGLIECLIYRRKGYGAGRKDPEGESEPLNRIVRMDPPSLSEAYETAEEERFNVADSDSDEAKDDVVLGEIAFAQRDFVTAEAFFRKASKRYRERPEVRIRNGQALMNLGAFSRALEAFEEALELDWRSAEALYGSALCHEKLENYDSAILSCEKTLAQIPDFWGVTDWFREYLLEKTSHIPFSADFTASVYCTLSTCHLRKKNIQDAILFVGAALSLDPEHPKALRVRDETIRSEETLFKDTEKKDGNSKILRNKDLIPVQELVTLVMVTHFTEKLKENRSLAPPGTGLVGRTYDSLLDVFGSGWLKCPKILCYDAPKTQNERSLRYRENLLGFSEQNGFDLTISNAIGLRRGLEAIMLKIKTPYFFLMEHDWVFTGPFISLEEIVGVFEKFEMVNQIRFNQRVNGIARFDFLMKHERDISSIPLLKTVAASNNPSFIRSLVFKNEWLPFIMKDAFFGGILLEGTPYGVEEPLFKRHIWDVASLGFEKAQRKWGTYVYGGMGEPPRIIHIGT